MKNDKPMMSNELGCGLLDDLSFRISHQIKGPIASMLGLLELIRIAAIREDETQGSACIFKDVLTS